MRTFAYHRPQSLEQAHRILVEHEGRACILAAGTDIIPRIKSGDLRPQALVSITGLDGLRGIGPSQNGTFRIGASTRLIELAESQLLRDRLPGICETAAVMGSPQVRNRASAGGNLCNAAPSADLCACLLAFDACALISTGDSERNEPLARFFLGPGKTSLGPHEILTAIDVPDPGPDHFATYLKLGARGALNLALVGVALCATPNGSHGFSSLRIALASVAPTPLRSLASEQIILQEGLTEQTIQEAARLASGDASPIDDQRASAQYRRDMVRIMVARALNALRRHYAA